MNYIYSDDYNNLNNLDSSLYINEDINDIYLKFKKIYNKDFINERIIKINKYKKVLVELEKLPLIKQRSEEWYELRKNRLTASDLGDAIAENNSRLVIKKSGLVEDNVNYNIIAPLVWGVMFEPMASRCYSKMNNNIKISEFGLIVDKKLEHFGASPDGINELGIMIEIKCPYSRIIKDGEIPKKYYEQMQGQLAVCELEECDYVEAEFKLYLSVDNYEEEVNKSININHGLIAVYTDKKTDENHYIYSDDFKTAKETINDFNNKVEEFNKINKKFTYIRTSPWYLNKINIQRVFLDKLKWSNKETKIIEFWDKVEKLREEGLPFSIINKKKEKVNFNDKTKYSFIKDDD